MERKSMILRVIVVVAIVTCKSIAADDDDCCLQCAARCIIWREQYYDLCYKPCCDCSGPPFEDLKNAKGKKYLPFCKISDF